MQWKPGAMRFNWTLKCVALVGIISCVYTVCLRTSCGNPSSGSDPEREVSYADQSDFAFAQYRKRETNSLESRGGRKLAHLYHEIDCNINSETSVKCRRERNEVYLPFTFIKQYFEVYGELVEVDDVVSFKFHHSNSEVHLPQPTYTPGSVFMAFDNFSVESRTRVKCVAASEGVPVTVQWNKDGYYYVIQVAQYGLSHHAKYVLGGKPGLVVLENGSLANWDLPDKKSKIKISQEKGANTHVMEFLTADRLKTKGITLTTSEKIYACIVMDVKFTTNGSISIVVGTTTTKVKIHYVLTDSVISFDGKSNIYYGLGKKRNMWIHLARDLRSDLIKGLLLKLKMPTVQRSFEMTRVLSIKLHGHGWVDNISLSQNVHKDQFYDAANWLVRNQDDRGGWPVMVQRQLVPGVMELPPGWYSAMGQGQAMSTLVRAFLDSKNEKYLQAAVNAMNIFEVDSTQGGVRTRFLGLLDWYEEYPTIPSSFVLNGFIYSLLGLYDLKETAKGDSKAQAERLYNSGMKSLKTLIGLFDSGAGTFYDLRHITTTLEPNRARWSYHTTHINQLLQLMIIDSDEIFKTICRRWMGYLKGKRAMHN